MASVDWGTGLNKFTAVLRSKAKALRTASDEIVEDSAEYGAAQMRYYIATRGTGYVGRGERATPEGRIDTGQMYDDVGVGQVRHNPSGVAINFGWVGNVEDYYRWQEDGFGTVPPMHALLDASIKTRTYFYGRIKELV